MIYDTLDHAQTYSGIHPGIAAGLKLLKTMDFSSLADGWHTVDGSDLRFLLDSYTVNAVNEKPEAHHDYIDIQCILEGYELIGVAPLATMEAEVEAHPERDIWYYKGDVTYVPLVPNRFLLLFPQDAHAPAVMPPEGPQKVRKCVVKVKV